MFNAFFAEFQQKFPENCNRQPDLQSKLYFLYITRNLVNDKYYCGKHTTSNINDNYLGSGTRLWNSIQYWGDKYFEKEILAYFNSSKEVTVAERILVDERMLADPLCINLKIGGTGGNGGANKGHKDSQESLKRKSIAQSGENNGMFGKNHKARSKQLMSTSKKGRIGWNAGISPSQETKNKISKTLTGNILSQSTKDKISITSSGENNGMYGKHGENNPNFGFRFIYHPTTLETMRVENNEINIWLQQGWINGRIKKVKSNVGRAWFYHPILLQNKLVQIEESDTWKQLGWIKGLKPHV